MKTGFNPLFAADLFFLSNLHWMPMASEVPAVNKPRRACLYVVAQLSKILLFFSQRSFHSPYANLRDNIV
jgi:hypothetical protein